MQNIGEEARQENEGRRPINMMELKRTLKQLTNRRLRTKKLKCMGAKVNNPK